MRNPTRMHGSALPGVLGQFRRARKQCLLSLLQPFAAVRDAADIALIQHLRRHLEYRPRRGGHLYRKPQVRLVFHGFIA